MTKVGERLIEGAEQALARVRGEGVPGPQASADARPCGDGSAVPPSMVVHEPRSAIDVRAVRRKTGLTQAAFARRFGFPVGTLRDWEQGIRTPQGPARALLLVIDAEPEAVLRALGKAA